MSIERYNEEDDYEFMEAINLCGYKACKKAGLAAIIRFICCEIDVEAPCDETPEQMAKECDVSKKVFDYWNELFSNPESWFNKLEFTKPLEIGYNYDIHELCMRKDTDPNKYIFKWNQDLYWGSEDPKDDCEDCINYLFTTRYANDFSELINIGERNISEGWVNVDIQTLYPMTIKELTDKYEEAYRAYFIDDYVHYIDILKVEKVD